MVNGFTYTSTVHPSSPRLRSAIRPTQPCDTLGYGSVNFSPVFLWRVLLSKSCCSASVLGELLGTLLLVSFIKSTMGSCFSFLVCMASLLDHLAFLSLSTDIFDSSPLISQNIFLVLVQD